MSALDKDTVKKIAFLARIEVPEEKLDPIAKDLSSILDWVEQLSEVNTDGVEEMTSVADMALHLRKDVVTSGDQPDLVLQNAPDQADHCYLVPKVVE
ncbi:Asp-tRNA(Asn)/Glu-tRNA(Gln) amidotransferase subunit GatC [Terasakiella sp. A23]|uniref:Asp-tRNA(Asn)/Glu-tRNA(Gln) amidotransferase subunit GatC n=1 Tax=Terasakiella sp. FCG-A23 TaxID=3080561 RepID=UPI0029552E57|nr:Asp-tRNA(Asn)/Glu-tRNA(Gln) amidotransferase subunit GatC [Terasakiella sp. A23]MDV7339282.1 Asp-tRNA(Asn)/Glu-tRNA(Gln) amidotransferase subunit GatC [Terasakiella sp. A23]